MKFVHVFRSDDQTEVGSCLSPVSLLVCAASDPSQTRFWLQIAWGACALVLTGNVVIFGTILGFFLVFGSNDDFSWQQW